MGHHYTLICTSVATAAATAILTAFGTFRLDREGIDAAAMLDASVSIKTVSHVRIDQFGDSVWQAGTGSGFLVDAETCEVWTNHHVVEDAAIVEVFPHGGARDAAIPARVVNSTPRADVAILRLERCQGIRPARLGDSFSIRPGDEVYAVGNPLGRHPGSITRGIISHVERYALGGSTPYLQTDAPITHGNSGGALYDRFARVIGINTAVAVNPDRTTSAIGYALPLHVAIREVARLHMGPPRWGDAGLEDSVSDLSPDEAAVFGVPDGLGAVVVTQAPLGGPSAGQLHAHDVIYRAGGANVSSVDGLNRLVQEHEPGTELEFELMRNGVSTAVRIVLADGWRSAATPAPQPYDGHLGLTLEMWSDKDGGARSFESPVITQVHGLGPAHRAHITSSQRALALDGPFVVPVQVNVNTVTGVVMDGRYHAVRDVETLETLAARGLAERKPLLLEIEHWARRSPMNPRAALERAATTFFKVLPATSEDVQAAAQVSPTTSEQASHPMSGNHAPERTLHRHRMAAR